MAVSKERLAEYLAKPPTGIDPLMWEQAKRANPDPSRFVPWPLFGFVGLKERVEQQEQELKRQALRLFGAGEKVLASLTCSQKVAQTYHYHIFVG